MAHLKSSLTEANRQAAKDCAKHDIPIIPVRLVERDGEWQKVPCISNWQNRGTTDPKTIDAWWDKFPDAMPGIPTGPISGFYISDVDRKNGKDGFAALEAEGIDPYAVSPIQVESPGDSLHNYLEAEPGLGCSGPRDATGKRLSGVDGKGEGGFVMAPGAVTPKGTYRFRKGDLDTLAAMRDARTLPTVPDRLRPRRRPVEPGEGNPTGLPPEVILSALEALPNNGDEFADREDWLDIGMALHAEFGGSEEGRAAFQGWSSQYTGGTGYDAAKTDAAWDSFTSGGGITGWTIIWEARRRGWTHPAVGGDDFDLEDVQVEPGTAEADDGELATLSPDDCADFQPVPYVVKELIAQRDMVTVVGAPGVGKSVLAPHLAYSVAQGRPVCGKRTRKGVVLYLAAENDRDMQKRIAALRTRHGACPDLHMLPACGGKFRDNDFLRKLRRLIQRLKPSLIVVDTLRAALPGIKENDSEGMGEAITTMRSLTKWGAAVLLVDHDNVAGSGLPRGHGSLHGDVDMNLALKRNDEGDVIGTPTKNRNGESYRPVLAYAIEPVDLDKLDEDGDPLTTVICEEKDVGEANRKAKERGLADHPQAALVHLRRLSEGGKRAVPETEWRDAFMADAAENEIPKSRQTAFRRAKDTLTDKKLIVESDAGYSLAGIPQPDPSEWTNDFPDPEEAE